MPDRGSQNKPVLTLTDPTCGSPVWSQIFESTDAPIAAVDAEGRFIALNRACQDQCEQLFSIRPQLGDSVFELAESLPADARELALALWRRALAGEEFIVAEEFGLETKRCFQIKWNVLRDAAGAPSGAFQYAIDITDQRQAERELERTQAALRQAQKMEAIGQLTGGVAHDFNNLLQVIGGNLQLLGRDVAGNPRAAQRVDNALAGVLRGAKLAAQLLAFSRKQTLEPRVLNLGAFIHGMDDMLRRTLGEGVELETIATGGLWNTLVDPSQLENSILNLAINARDAMNGRGKLTIEVGNAYLDDAYAAAHQEVTAGQYVQVAVSDTGSGMSSSVAERAFEPFYTTKQEGHGSGLGLSMVFGFVKQSGGHIKIYTEPGHGTTIKMYLPRTNQPQDVLEIVDSGSVTGGSETILLVEDDEDVRETVASMLRDLGYTVFKAKDAASAMIIIDSGVAIDILFTDVVMPGKMRSPDLARRAQERLPKLKVLFTSGYTANAIVHGGRLDEGVQLLSKPYTQDVLARKLRTLLDE